MTIYFLSDATNCYVLIRVAVSDGRNVAESSKFCQLPLSEVRTESEILLSLDWLGKYHPELLME